ncbi:MAG TPA: RES family NAD+ phosphorylase [Gemmatimonadales bacterium]
MLLFRICRRPFRALDGEGARLYGGRWNEPGRPVVYLSTSIALAALEYLVHVDPDDAPDDLATLTVEVPDDATVETVDVTTLPGDWARASESATCREVGERWLRNGRALLLRVPSVLVPEESNVLLDPRHPDAERARVVGERPFVFDPRSME